MSNLLDKASIILTPTAYNNGEALCVKPSDASGDFQFSRNSAATRVNAQGLVENVQILSSNLVQNGDFSEEGSEEVSNGSFTNGSTNWSLGTGWSIAEDKAVYDGSGYDAISQIIPNLIGKVLKFQFDIVDYTSGTIRISPANKESFSDIRYSNNGTYVEYYTSDQDRLDLQPQLFDGSITNISIKEVGQDWDFSSGAFVTDIGARLTEAPTAGVINSIGYTPLVIGNNYKMTYEITQSISGGVKLNSAINTSMVSSVGIHTKYFEADNTFIQISRTDSGGNDITITNISIIEITTDTNLPRINYENGCGSWLFEPQSTNLVTYSEDFSQWVAGADISIQSGYLAPDGNNTAYKVTKTGTSQPYLTYNLGLTATTTRSIYARTVSGTGTATLLSHNSNTNNTFTLTEQWQRFELSDTASSSGQSTFYAADFRGSGTLTEYLVWGANATNDQDYATSYIPTDGSTVTRNQDLCTNGGSLASINSTEGVLYAEIAALENTTSAQFITISDGTYNNRASISLSSSSAFSFRVFLRVGGVPQVDRNILVSDVTDFNKVALSYKENDFKIYVNGSLVQSYTSGSVWGSNTINNLSFSEIGFQSGAFNGKTKCLAVWKEALTDAELTELTTI